MKRSDIDIFNNESSRMNPAFRSKLRRQLVKMEARSGKHPAGTWYRQLWLVPIGGLVIAVLLLAIGFNFHKPNQQGSPLKPQAVSAADIIRRTDTAQSVQNAAGYTYFRNVETDTYGPAAVDCEAGSYTGDSDAAYVVSGYRAADGVEEAYFFKKTTPDDRQVPAGLSAYDNTKRALFDSRQFLDSKVYTSLSQFFGRKDSSKNVLYYLSDSEGKRLDPNTGVATSTYQGKDVYKVYAVSNPASQDALVPCWPAGSNRDPKSPVGAYFPPTYEPEIIQYTFDAHTFTTLSRISYRGSISDTNLLLYSEQQIDYEKFSSSEALDLMTRDGFDQAQATDTIVGKD